MDLNNQMVCMRKDIKRAKVRVIFKLVRRIRSLKTKKGSDVQQQKNKKRAEKMIEEIGFIKDAKPDIIFKFLLNTDLTFEDVNKLSDSKLQHRAFIRIGLVPLIKQKIDTIRRQVNDFDRSRSKKDETTSLKLVNKITTANPTSKIPNVSKEKKNETVENVEIPVSKMRVQTTVDSMTSQNDTDVLSDDEANSVVENPCEDEEEEEDGNLSHKFESEEDEDIFQVEPPEVYKRSNPKVSSDEASSKKHFILPSEGNISDIFVNLGQGYNDSDDERSEEIKSSGSEEEEEEDDFFISETSNNKKRKLNRKKPPDVDEEKMSNLKSAFVTTLSYKEPKSSMHETRGETFPKRKRKNRLGQRARKKMYGNSTALDRPKKPLKGKRSSSAENPIKQKDSNSLSESNLHPSWTASRQRKQQSGIKEFSGKHIRFDD